MCYNLSMSNKESINKLTGLVVPLGALYTKENSVIGQYPDLKAFSDFCKECGISLIQLLPVNDTGTQSSPYSGLSAFALHPIYISLKDISGFDDLYKSNPKFKKAYDKFLNDFPYSKRYDYDGILNSKINLLKMLYETTLAGKEGKADEELTKWIKANSWVKTYCVYKNLKWNYMQASWKSWIESDQFKTDAEITKLWNTMAFKKEHLFYAWLQMLADQQFSEAVAYVRKNKILIKGDMPILMNEDSCDAWAHPEFFNQDLRAGSPADGENPNGQNWGFPTYNWKNLKSADYSWWNERLKQASNYYDAYRLDHILGFFRIWAIPEADINALNGHTEPYTAIKKESLYEMGFDDDRIRWLSQPHIPTGAIEDITWNHDTAHQILATFCNQIHDEELWIFDPSVKGAKTILDADISELCHPDAIDRVKKVLCDYWTNRCLIEISKNKFVPVWTYSRSTAWQSLNPQEKKNLEACFMELNKKNEKLWQKQADEIFTALTSAVKMIPCGEDLGVNIECVPTVMKKHKILGLKVARWCRNWSEDGQPYIPFDKYEPLSVTTTSVHDSSTIRQWWHEEKMSVSAFVQANSKFFGIDTTPQADRNTFDLAVSTITSGEFTPEIAHAILKAVATSASLWNISPLQDYLYLNKKYWLPEASDERINIPGTVTSFNWTYRLPATIEELTADQELISKIKNIIKTQEN